MSTLADGPYTRSAIAAELNKAKSVVSLSIVDTWANITGYSANITNTLTDNLSGNVYILQKLVPNTSYKLTYSLAKLDSATQVFNDIPGAINMTTSRISGVSDLLTTPPNADEPNRFYFITDSLVKYAAFRTKPDNGVTMSEHNQTRIDSAASGYRPSDSRGFTNFATQSRFYTLHSSRQLPINVSGTIVPYDQITPNKHAYDGYMFIFPYEAITTNENLTTRFNSGSYIGYDAGDLYKGFIRIPDIQINMANIIASNALNNFNDTQFISGGTFGASLDKNLQYTLAMIVYDKTSNYVLHVIQSVTPVFQWFTQTMDLAGIWSVNLASFVPINTSVYELSASTAMAISIDGISTIGTVIGSDQYRLTITATPIP